MNIVQVESLRGRKKAERRLLILEVARKVIAENGLRSLKIRDVANAADCSVGSIYNEFADFDGVILTVSRETVQSLASVLSKVSADDPAEHLHGLASAYLDFSMSHANLLRALFEHRMEGDKPFPEDLLQMVMNTFALMYGPLQRLLPDMRKSEVAMIARTLFSAVHGIISLGLEERLVAVPPKDLHRHVRQFVETHLVGLGVDRPSPIKKTTKNKRGS